MNIDWGVRENLEAQIQQKKRLREIYEFIVKYAPYINIEYEGRFKRQGDTVLIRPRLKLFEHPTTSRKLSINTKLPRVGRFDYIMNKINWGVPADLVIVCDNNFDFYMGYQEYPKEG